MPGRVTIFRYRSSDNSFSRRSFHLRPNSTLSPDPKCYFWLEGIVPRSVMREFLKK
jgi:hypothetical protein